MSESGGNQIPCKVGKIVPRITAYYQHVLKKYSKLGASTPVLSAVFGEELYGFANCFLSLALLLQQLYLCLICKSLHTLSILDTYTLEQFTLPAGRA